jgi:hypothetical protein
MRLTALQAAEKLASLKGTAFRPYITAEGCFFLKAGIFPQPV